MRPLSCLVIIELDAMECDRSEAASSPMVVGAERYRAINNLPWDTVGRHIRNNVYALQRSKYFIILFLFLPFFLINFSVSLRFALARRWGDAQIE